MRTFGVGSTATWAKWVDRGLPRSPRGRGYSYDPDEIRAGLEANPQPGHGGDRYDMDDADGDLDATEAQDLYRRERALKTAAERELRELKLAEERGELVRSSEVDAEWRRAALLIRTQVMQVADKVAPYVTSEVEDRIRQECRNVLATLASETESAETERKVG